MSEEKDDDFLPGIRGAQLHDEASEDSRIARRSRFERLYIVLLLLIIAACGGYFFYGVVKMTAPKPRPPLSSQQLLMRKVFQLPPPAGDPSAKVVVLAVVPTNTTCQKETCDFLVNLAKKYPDKIRVRFFDLFGDNDDANVLSKYEIECSTILINGKFKFDFRDEKGKEERFLFSGAPTANYDLNDIAKAIQAELIKNYGAAPKDFMQFVQEMINKLSEKQKERILRERANRPRRARD